MIISHVKIIAFQTIIIHCLWIFYIARKDCSLYNKQNNTCVFGNTRFISRVKHDISCVKHDITYDTRNKSGISAHHVLFSIYTYIYSFLASCDKFVEIKLPCVNIL